MIFHSATDAMRDGRDIGGDAMIKLSHRLLAPSACFLALATQAAAQAPAAASPEPNVLGVLMMCGVMGLIGQGARVAVGMTTLAVYKLDAPASNEDVFNLARLVFSLIIGFLAGFIAGLTQWNAVGIDHIAVSDFSAMMKYAIAGYIGADVIEAFTSRFFDKKTVDAARDAPHPADGDAPATPAPVPDHVARQLSDISEQVASVHGLLGAMSAPKGAITGTDYPAWALSRDVKVARDHYWDAILEGANAHNLPVSVVCAIGSKESHWGLALNPPGPAGVGDPTKRDPAKWGSAMPTDGLPGWGRGLMQIDWYSNEFAKTGAWRDPTANILFGCDLLARKIATAAKTNPDPNIALRCGVSAYNGMKGPHSSYCDDVMARADWISQQGLDR